MESEEEMWQEILNSLEDLRKLEKRETGSFFETLPLRDEIADKLEKLARTLRSGGITENQG